METLFGKNYETLGNSENNLLLKTLGEIKIQVGNKFIDLVKGNEMSSLSDSIIQYTENTPNSNFNNGIYTNGINVWLVFNSVVITLK